MVSKKQQDEIIERVTKTVYVFMDYEGKISDEDLALVLNNMGVKTSSSTVGRDLTSQVAKDIFGDNICGYILLRRKKNQLEARSKGGKTFANNNISLKDDFGKFNGSKKR